MLTMEVLLIDDESRWWLCRDGKPIAGPFDEPYGLDSFIVEPNRVWLIRYRRPS